MSPLVGVEKVGRVLVATLSRPPVNAINDALVAELDAVLDRAIDDPGVAVLHLRSDQRVFSAGADLALIESCFATPQGPDAMTEVVRNMQRLYRRLEAAPLVTLAEIATTALGGGLELALACDLRVAALEARLGLPEARLGLLPGAGGTQRLTRLCGPGVAKRLILGAEVVDGADGRAPGHRAMGPARHRSGCVRAPAGGPVCRDAEGRPGGQQALHRRGHRPRVRRLRGRDHRDTRISTTTRKRGARCRRSWPGAHTDPLKGQAMEFDQQDRGRHRCRLRHRPRDGTRHWPARART